jgi:hypothetical protein
MFEKRDGQRYMRVSQWLEEPEVWKIYHAMDEDQRAIVIRNEKEKSKLAVFINVEGLLETCG